VSQGASGWNELEEREADRPGYSAIGSVKLKALP
jgi:hypothetical protein